jgi:hypothetical protein
MSSWPAEDRRSQIRHSLEGRKTLCSVESSPSGLNRKKRDSLPIQDKILPILEAQPGFVDEIVLLSDTEPDQILALSFWKSQQDAERYTHDQFPRVNELISHLVESAPGVEDLQR